MNLNPLGKGPSTLSSYSKQSLPALAILLGASVWGVIWYPLRLLAALGISGTLASALVGFSTCLFLWIVFWRSLSTGLRSILSNALPISRYDACLLLAALAFAGGMTNIGFTWGAIHGQVMRVMLLFYLSPAWTVFFAHWLLHERINAADIAIACLSLAGAMLMLWSPELGVPLPADLAEWAGLLAGISFALQNVLSRKISRVLPSLPAQLRTVTIFGGGALVGLALIPLEPFSLASLPLAPPALSHALLLTICLGAVLALNNMLVQYGIQRIAANRAALIMLFEIVITALSVWWLTGEMPKPREWSGASCIIVATLLSSWVHRRR
ncbi:Uncharacterized protein MCB1EB_1037 [Mycoavidus cysteinexigens]|uniref:Uncharacterized protein n=1 Tax=Mycoavidus cysteinexigens TaxID=1553431 RepID=A0A2Z6EUW1_9BURK|nr:DMT family transporter [Mycoavidus cysteinexigens]BBE09198.1 Uncharacterized protein MCB1EB_1037 [Mycoavidus cysteinexigens]GAM52050.1 probable multidrug DMT transporter permease [bacterium endosymbiont of Mortierella elongata FMR23-6]GLR02157.1 hypothetical protein GCM10007934_19710 [Mycoavidus cysteinexigens]